MYKSHMLHVWYIYLHYIYHNLKPNGLVNIPFVPWILRELQLEKVGLLRCCFFLDCLRCGVGKMLKKKH